jgi:hypothetical protein
MRLLDHTERKMMMKKLCAMLTMAVLLSACGKSEDGAGPAERAGRTLDQATEKTSRDLTRAAEEAGEKVQQAARDASVAIDEASDSVSEAVKRNAAKAGEKMEQAGQQLQEKKAREDGPGRSGQGRSC